MCMATIQTSYNSIIPTLILSYLFNLFHVQRPHIKFSLLLHLFNNRVCFHLKKKKKVYVVDKVASTTVFFYIIRIISYKSPCSTDNQHFFFYRMGDLYYIKHRKLLTIICQKGTFLNNIPFDVITHLQSR